jgi:hypothetical protein
MSTGEELDDSAGEGDAAQLAADDVEDLISRNRVQQIFQARNEVRQAFQRVPVLEAQGARSEPLEHVLSAGVQSYLSELEPLAHAADDDLLTYYWEEHPLGTQTVHPPQPEGYDRMGVKLQKVESPFGEQPEPQAIELEWQGLQSIAEADPPFTYTWTFHAQIRHRGDETETKRRQVTIPRHILRGAFRAANLFASEVNLDLQLEEETEDFDLRYIDSRESQNGHGGR